MSDLISREALLKEFNQTAIEWLQDGTYQLQFAAGVMCEVMEMVTKAPTVDAVEVVHGQWKRKPHWCVACSCCGRTMHDYEGETEIYNYCPYCGARMDEVTK